MTVEENVARIAESFGCRVEDVQVGKSAVGGHVFAVMSAVYVVMPWTQEDDLSDQLSAQEGRPYFSPKLRKRGGV